MARRKLDATVKLKGIVTTDEESKTDDWHTKKKLTYMGNIDGVISVKLQLDADDPETLKSLISPVKGQQFQLNLKDVSPKDTKIDEFTENKGPETDNDDREIRSE